MCCFDDKKVGKRNNDNDRNEEGNIKPGTRVRGVQKQDQRTGKLTDGVVLKILTNSQNHPHGIKVMLEGDIVGRVKDILD